VKAEKAKAEMKQTRKGTIQNGGEQTRKGTIQNGGEQKKFKSLPVFTRVQFHSCSVSILPLLRVSILPLLTSSSQSPSQSLSSQFHIHQIIGPVPCSFIEASTISLSKFNRLILNTTLSPVLKFIKLFL